jgi:hypothetical protein
MQIDERDVRLGGLHMLRVMSWMRSLLIVLLLTSCGFVAFRLLEASLAAQVYRDRLAELGTDYEELRGRYNRAVRRTAVTELVVENGVLTVVIRTADGEIQALESPFDPAKEIYVDYVVHGGRLWIRRVFDESTPPGEGMVIDPRFVDVDWGIAGENHGKAAYRELGEGRWVVDVTGDGSLGLARIEAGVEAQLAPPPPVRRYEPVDEAVEGALAGIRPSEALRALAGQLKLGR